MQRRRFMSLASTTGFAVLAGCADGGDASTNRDQQTPGSQTDGKAGDADEPVRYTPGEAADLGGESVTVESFAVRDVAVVPHSIFAVVEDPEGFQFVVCGLSADGSVDRSALSFEPWVDGEPVDFEELAPSYRGGPPLQSSDETGVPIEGGPDTSGDRPVAVPFPAGDHDRAGLVIRSGDVAGLWTLPDSVVANLRRVPDYRVHDASVGIFDDAFEFEITVENAGERDGVYQGIIKASAGADIDDVFTMAVPAGETVTARVPIPWTSADRVDEQNLPTVAVTDPKARTFSI